MTVHGAKGLQAPLVVLPDTTQLPPDQERWAWAATDGVAVPLWAPRKELTCAAVQRARDAAADLRRREHNRLLYVALTRAEDRLVVCGWQTGRDVPEKSWYSMVRRGFERIGADPAPFEELWGRRNAGPCGLADRPGEGPECGSGVRAASVAGMGGAARRLAARAAAGRAGAAEAIGPEPAHGGGVRSGAPSLVAAAGGAGAALRPRHGGARLAPAPADRAGRRAAAGSGGVPGADAVAGRRASRVGRASAGRAGAPSLAAVVRAAGPGGAAAVGPGRRQGRVRRGGPDGGAAGPRAAGRLQDGPRGPAVVEDTPLRYVRQLAAYRSVLRALFPGRLVECALVWTEDATVTVLPEALLEQHGPEAA